MQQTSDSIIYVATNGQSGRYGFSGQEVDAGGALFGAVLGGGTGIGKAVSGIIKSSICQLKSLITLRSIWEYDKVLEILWWHEINLLENCILS